MELLMLLGRRSGWGVEGSSQDSHLYSVGLTFEAVGELIPQGNMRLQLDWAFPLGNYTSTQVDGQTFYAGLTQFF